MDAAIVESTIAPVRPVLQAIESAGGQPLIVGGAVRDLLLGHPSQDIDIEVYALDVEHLGAALSTLGRVDAVGRSFGVLKLAMRGGPTLDLALPQRGNRGGTGARGFIGTPDPAMTVREAAARRDFTWNAMALTPAGELLDFFGGAADLRAGIIRHTSQAFGEDPLRVLRAIQFAARFDMELAPATAALCHTLLPEAAHLAIERVWGEWHKWALQGRRPAAGLRALRATGWIALYPELEALQGCPQDPVYHPEGDVWQHTLAVCDAAAGLAERERLEGDARAVLLFAALCHDLGKPATTTLEVDRIRSRGHARAGVAPAQALLERIGCLKSVAAQVAPLVREHSAYLSMQVSARTVRRLAVRLAPATIAQWGLLVEADRSGRPPLAPSAPGAAIVELAQRLGAAAGRPVPILLGRHLIAAGMQAGPELGKVLRRAYKAQIDGAFATVDEGLEWLARNQC